MSFRRSSLRWAPSLVVLVSCGGVRTADTLVALPFRAEAEGGYAVDLPAVGVRVTMDAGGLSGAPALSLGAWGREGARSTASPAVPRLSADARRVEYPRGTVTEWWVAGSTGLELGFDLAEAPPAEGRVELLVTVDGAELVTEEGATDLALVEPSGRRWAVGPVSAVDASGTVLDAGMEIEDGALVLWVDDAHARYPIEVDPVLTTAGTTLTGASASSSLGSAVSGAGDVNRDGYDDVLVGAPGYSSSAGRAYVYLGSAAGLSSSVATTLEAGTANGRFGVAVASAGDVTGDGYGDVVVGEEGQNRAWVYLGSSRGLSSSGTSLAGDASSVRFGHAVGAADVDGDGYTDVLVGDGGFNGGKGRTYVFPGSAVGVRTSASTRIDGSTLGSDLGDALAGVGDVTGDGYDDVVLGAPTISSNAGAFYLYAGSSSGLSTSVTSSYAGRSGGGMGTALAGGCDLDGDGYMDVIAGAPLDGSGVGAAAVYLGDSTGLSAAARSWTGPDGGGFGGSVACVGDTDGDGYDDVMVGAAGASGGRAYVFHGIVTGARSSATDTLSSASGVRFGGAVGAAGDVNNDGATDVLVGDPSTSNGNAYAYLGDLDRDGDGYGRSTDCDDAAPAVHPGATETPADGVDEDCDGHESCYIDADNDGYRTSSLTTVTSADADCSDAGEALSSDPATDCNDTSSTIHPTASETIGDGVDQDCDTRETCYQDTDNDGYRTSSTVLSADLDCTDPGEALPSETSGDCDDTDGHAHPSATEVVADGIDQDCNGGERCYEDADDDGHRPDAISTVASADLDCTDRGEATGSDPVDDCDDTRSSVNPSATESVADGIDEDCDGRESCYVDGDGDGYRLTSTILAGDLTCSARGLATAAVPTGDCDDSLASVHPGATETVGDAVDQDCDSHETCYVDVDRDGYRPGATYTVTSSDLDCVDAGEASNTVATNDCDDANAAIHPGVSDTVGDGIDADCDGSETCYVDADNDGYRLTTTVASADGDCTDSGEASSSEPTGDCDDTSRGVHPGAPEQAADGVDQDCDGVEHCYVDADGDGYRPDGTTTVDSPDLTCVAAGEADATVPTGDCNDADATIVPGATELTGDGVDQNCDGAELCYADNDGDGYHTGMAVSSADADCLDRGEALGSDPDGDCDDAAAAVHPGATEVPADGIDETCDGVELCYVDVDADGYRPDGTTTVSSADLACDGAGETTGATPTGDCDDTDPVYHPGATEIVGDGLDQDCDGVESCYQDVDADGYRTDAALPSADLDCADVGEVPESTPAGDCDDVDAAIHPGATEIVADRVDQDCDGTELCFQDADDDGYRPDETSTVVSPDLACDGSGEAGDAARTTDCNDADGAIHPAAEELPGDEVDQDCDGAELCYTDVDGDGVHSDTPIDSVDADCTDDGEATDDLPGGDCDDTNALVLPGAIEVCNGLDDNCDGATDGPDAEGNVTWAADADGDGYTNPADTANGCAPTDGYGTPSAVADCDDTDGDVSPAATEIAGDGVDNDCDGSVDESVVAGDDTGTADKGGGCGCAAGSGDEGAAGAWALALAAGVLYRRRRSTVSRIQRSSDFGKSSV